MFSKTCRMMVSATVLFVLAPAAGAAGLVEVQQVIFGMDCAPCAFGVERGLKKLPGVESVRVSLNEGKTELRLKPNAAVDLEQIRAVIRDNGFTPKAATLTITGTIERTGEDWVLDAGTAGRYRLDPTLVQVAAGQTVTLQAEAAEGVNDRLTPPPGKT